MLAATVPDASEGDPRRTALLAGVGRGLLRRQAVRNRAGERRRCRSCGRSSPRACSASPRSRCRSSPRGSWSLTRAALPLVVASGLCEVGGFASFALGSRHGIAVAAVLASQFAAVAAVSAYVLFHERLTRLQLAGAVAIVAGVAGLTALQA